MGLERSEEESCSYKERKYFVGMRKYFVGINYSTVVPIVFTSVQKPTGVYRTTNGNTD